MWHLIKYALFLEQETRHDAEDIAALTVRCAGTSPHQSNAAAAIDQTDILLRQRATEVLSQLQIALLNLV